MSDQERGPVVRATDAEAQQIWREVDEAAARGGNCAARDARIAALERERDEALAAIDYEGAKAIAKQAQSVIDEKDARIVELESQLAEFDQGAGGVLATLASRDARIAELEGQVEGLKGALVEIKSVCAGPWMRSATVIAVTHGLQEYVGRNIPQIADEALSRTPAQHRSYISQLREGIAWAYQFAGAVGAPTWVLDNFSALAHGEAAPHEWQAAEEPAQHRSQLEERIRNEERRALLEKAGLATGAGLPIAIGLEDAEDWLKVQCGQAYVEGLEKAAEIAANKSPGHTSDPPMDCDREQDKREAVADMADDIEAAIRAEAAKVKEQTNG